MAVGAGNFTSPALGAVTREGLTEQQRIADAFLAEGLLPRAVDTRDVRIWQPGS